MSDAQTPMDFDPLPDPQPDSGSRTIILQPRRSFLRFLTEHNPFYLLSAACMLASCLALTNSLSWTSITRSRLLTLIVTLNIYEAALLAIALFLIVQRKLRRDGRILLLLQAFFLADFSFLNAEIATADVRTGLIVNGILLVLAAIKLGIVIRVLNPSFTALQFGFVLIQLALLFATPIALRWLDTNRGIVNPRQFYVVWWMIGLLPAVYELFARLDRGRILRVSPDAQSAPTTAWLALPYVSLLAHVGTLHWVYQVDYFGAHAAPLLLGLTLVLNRFSPTARLPRGDLLVLRFLMPAAAVLVSMNDPFVFQTPMVYPRLGVTSLSLTLAGAFFVYLYCFLLPYARIVLLAGSVAVAVYAFGPTWQQTNTAVETGWNRLTTMADRLMPKTLSDWGILGLGASFAFLAIGFAVSLKKQPDVPPVPEALPPAAPET